VKMHCLLQQLSNMVKGTLNHHSSTWWLIERLDGHL
jgi:hypothetical protein